MENQGSCLTPFERKLLLKSLQTNLRSEYSRRIRIMLLADEGLTQAQICAELSCSHETARYWMAMARNGQAHHWQGNPIGRPETVNEVYLERLQSLVRQSPRELGYPFRRWTAQWLGKHLAQELGIEISDRHINRLLKKLGLSTRSASLQENKATEAGITIQDLPAQAAPQFFPPLDLMQIHR